MKNVYRDGTYLQNNPAWHEEDSPWKAQQITKMLEKNDLIFESVAEVGCGAGVVLSRLAESYPAASFSGYDISGDAIKKSRAHEGSNIEFFQKDLLQNPEAQFDLALAIDVFEHVEDYFAFLRNFKCIATHKIFHIPLDLSLQSVLRIKPILRSRSHVGHLHYFFKETALETLKDCEYDIIDWFYTGGSIQAKNRGWKSRFMRIPRMCMFALNNDFAVRFLGGYSLLVLAK